MELKLVDSVSWSFTVGASSGAGFSSNGKHDVEATTSAVVALEANMNAPTDLSLQLADVEKIAFLAIGSSLADGSVEVKADGADAVAMTGPLILFGKAVKLFAGDLATLSVQNKHATKEAKLTLLIARKLSPDGT